VAGYAEQGLRLLSNGAVSKVVCDYNLPEENGLKLVKRIRALTIAMTIVMLSDEDEPTLPRRVLAAGAQAFLTKTTPAHILLQKIRLLTCDLADKSIWNRTLQLCQRLHPSSFQNKRRASA